MDKTTLYIGAITLWLSGLFVAILNNNAIGHEYMACGIALFWIGYSIEDKEQS